MYAGVVITQTDPGRADEVQAIYRDSIIPMARQQHGAKGLLLLIDRNTGKTISIGLWETEADARAFESSGRFQESVAKFTNLFQKPPIREVYEVAVQKDL